VTTALLLLMMGASFLLPLQSNAQCPTGYAVTTEQHNTTATGNGADATPFTLPQFVNPGGGTFLSAQVDVFLTNHITVTFTNSSTTSAPPAGFKATIARPDELDLNGSDVYDANGSVKMPATTLTVAPGPGSSVTFNNLLVYNNVNIADYTIGTADPSLTDYEGAGNLSFLYTPFTYINFVPAPAVAGTPTIVDNLTFQVTYSYCEATVLASNITIFTATRENDQLVALNWNTSNEVQGRRYHIQASIDGNNFSDYGSPVVSDSVNSNASYSYDYTLAAGASGKLYFRLKQVQSNGTASYSAVRVVDLGSGGPSGFYLYPNPPSDYINLNFPVAHTWQVDIISADGTLIQRNYYPATSVARVNFNRKLSSGIYFARATDAQDGKGYVGSFTIR
jgi:hypothetical protein